MMVTSVKPRDWPSGDCWVVGQLDLTPETACDKYGITFHPDADDLDDLVIAALDAGVVGQLWLVHYKRSPDSRLEVWADTAIAKHDVLDAIRRLLGEQIRWPWLNPYACDPNRERPANESAS